MNSRVGLPATGISGYDAAVQVPAAHKAKKQHKYNLLSSGPEPAFKPVISMESGRPDLRCSMKNGLRWSIRCDADRYEKATFDPIHRLGRAFSRPGPVNMDSYSGPLGRTNYPYPPARAGTKSGRDGGYDRISFSINHALTASKSYSWTSLDNSKCSGAYG